MSTQFKEYSAKDFLYSGKYTNYKEDDCKKTPSDWDDLIGASCNKYDEMISINVNNIAYTVTTSNTINTIQKIADEFNRIQRLYVFGVGTSGDTLIIKGAKLTFNPTNDINSASKLLGYVEDGKDYMLPYTFPNTLDTTKNNRKYVIDACYNVAVNYIVTDIRASSSEPYYDFITKKLTKTPYSTPVQLQDHLNNKRIFANPDKSLYYKFNYVSGYDKMKVVDLIRETQANELQIKIKIEGKEYKFNKPNKSNRDATTTNDVVYDNSIFRKYNSRSDGIGKRKKKIIFPKVNNITVKLSDDGTLVWDDLPSFQIVFKDIDSDPVLRYSANTYLLVDDSYVKLSSFTKQVTKKYRSNDATCKTANINKALCENKTHANNIMTKTMNHTGANQRYMDTQAFSDTSMLNIFNLGIGIVGIAVFIANTYK